MKNHILKNEQLNILDNLVIGKILTSVILSVVPIVAVKVIVTRKTRSWYKVCSEGFHCFLIMIPVIITNAVWSSYDYMRDVENQGKFVPKYTVWTERAGR